MIKKIAFYLEKFEQIRNPLRIKKSILNRVEGVFSKIYDHGMLAIDRVSSVVFVIVLDFINSFKDKNRSPQGVMICRYAGYSDNGNQESTEKLFLDDTLSKYLGEGNGYSTFCWDDNRPVVGFGINFYRKVISLNPKHLILSSYASDVFFQPMPWVVARLKRRNVRTVALWWDTCSPEAAKKMYPIVKAVDANVILDNPVLDLGESKESQLLKNKALTLVCPYDVHVKTRMKDLDVVFLGQVSSYRDGRSSYLKFLVANNIALHSSVNDRNDQCSHADYYEKLSRGKIGLSFSMSVDRHQFKGRVIETMLAGCLLLDERNMQTAYYFNEGEDYVAFSSENEMLEKIKYYLINEDERMRIAESGMRKVKKLTSGRYFWEKVLGA